MISFDKDIRKKLQNLEAENKKLLDRVSKLENQYISIAKDFSSSTSAHNSKKISEFRNKSEARLEDITRILSEVELKSTDIQNILSGIQSNQKEAIELKKGIESIDSAYKGAFENLKERVENLSLFMDKYPDLDKNLSEINDFILEIEGNLNKSKTTLNSINSKKQEIDELHESIFGYKDSDEQGNEIFIEGKKDELDNAYSDLGVNISKLKEKILSINDEQKSKYADFEKIHKAKYEQIISEIKGLLPNALTAGLSSAFSKKRDEEETLSISLQKRFSIGIGLLIFVSVIPFVVSVLYVLDGHSIDETILKMPRLVLSIIPMYVPILWFTYSSSKKLNLSKRLIEEYAHKEVLSKTYEGLSTQIANIDDENQSEELKYRLLSTFLQVVSENPGKLISNYQTSDHPLMEVLEQSYKFQLAIDKLEGIPGMGKIATILESKSKKKTLEKEKIIEKTIQNIPNPASNE